MTEYSTKEKVLTTLYESVFPAAAKYISRRGGTFEQAKDIFQDALVIWYERFSTDEKAVHSQKAYLFGITKHLWYRKFASEKETADFELTEAAGFEDKTYEEPSAPKLLQLLENAGRKCMQLLKAVYYDKLSMAELASGFGFRSEHSAAVQKYKCLEKVRETVKEKSLCYEDFLE